MLIAGREAHESPLLGVRGAFTGVVGDRVNYGRVRARRVDTTNLSNRYDHGHPEVLLLHMPRKESIVNASTAQAQQDSAAQGIDTYELPKSLVTRLARAAVSLVLWSVICTEQCV